MSNKEATGNQVVMGNQEATGNLEAKGNQLVMGNQEAMVKVSLSIPTKLIG